jgi:hypothetical protein
VENDHGWRTGPNNALSVGRAKSRAPHKRIVIRMAIQGLRITASPLLFPAEVAPSALDLGLLSS